MDYRKLGKSSLKVSPLSLGAMMFGGPTDADTAQRIIDSARDRGVNFLDTAAAYHNGDSERVVGNALRSQRDFWVLATKFSLSLDPNPNHGGFSRKAVIASAEASLSRLATDYIDILYFHQDIPDADLEEPLRAIGDMIAQGKIRYYGLSNFRGWRIGEVVRLADKIGMPRPVVSQPLYNIVNRSAEVEELPAAAHYGLGVATYSPLARGVLTGKYRPDAEPDAESRAGRKDYRFLQTEWRAESITLSQRVAAYCAERDVSPIGFALAWVLNNRLISSIIAGPRTEDQWNTYLSAIDTTIAPADEQFVDDLIAPGHSSTPGFTDPMYPVNGRKLAGVA